ncbi:MAG: peptidase U32 family protein [Anaerovoracaceae bacterium]|jgi:putative protease
MKKIELLAPAGDLEKLKTACEYGADAVYFGGEMFSLRAGAGNMDLDEMREGIEFAHRRGKKCHLAFNIFPHNEDIEPMAEYLEKIKGLGIDAFIVSDPGTIVMIRDIVPDAEIHLSTQANMTNYRTARFWHEQGVKRTVLARELTLGEIRKIRDNIPEDMDIEAFVHGAMCISYSGRCLLSNFMIERDANRGQCAHPCRWKYALEEEKRPGEYYPIEEDDRGTYIMNSKDLCMIEHIDDLAKAGVTSFKIEGRMKSMYYVAVTVGAYRRAIDAYEADPQGWKFDPSWMEELCKASHREFTTGFYYDKPSNMDQNYRTSEYIREYSFTGVVRDYDAASGLAMVEQRNKMNVGDEIEIFGPDADSFSQRLDVLLDEEKQPVESAPHPQQKLYIRMERPVKRDYLLRKKK